MFRYEHLKAVSRRHPNAPSVYSYATTDLLAEVTTQGYFNDSRAQLVEGDFILVSAGDGVRTMTVGDSTSAEPAIENFIFINDTNDLPDASSGVITLLGNTTYYFTAEIDLTGDRLLCGPNTVILGPSSEQARIKSTGLSGSALITSEWSLPIRHITLEASQIFDLDATANASQALDWYGVNLVSSNIGTITNYNNFIASSMAFLSASGLTFDGTFGTIAITESLLLGVAGTTITIPATCTITRRMRIGNCSIIAVTGNTALDVSASASIPVEGYILDKINFSGTGTYTTGVTYIDNKSRWEGNRGVINSASVTGYYMTGNSTATSIGGTGTPVKVAGSTTGIAITQRFTNTDNRATYTGEIDRDFKVTVTLSLSSGNNHQIGAYIAKNGTEVDESETYLTTNSAGRLENGMCQALIPLTTDDYLEIYVENNTSTTDITVEDLNVIIQAIN